MNIYFTGMCISMIAYIVIGFLISRSIRDSNDFYVAGRRAPTLLIAGSLIASYCSTGLFMGDTGEAFSGFYTPVLITVTMQIAGYVLGSVFFGRFLRRSGAMTIPDFFGKRFDSSGMRILAAITGLVIYLVYMLSITQGIGTLMQYVTGLNYNLCITLALATVILLTVTSGSTGVLITDTLMFGIFTAASIVAAFVIVRRTGGWGEALRTVTAVDANVFSWHGSLNHYYPTGAENMIWAVMTGITWVAVCMVGPWQSSRYLMAKNEHVVIRSSCIAAIFVFLIEFFMLTVGAFMRKFTPDIPSPSYAMIWGAVNLLPIGLGTVMLTGILAAGISSGTTFLSLIGSTFACDLVNAKDEKQKLLIGKLAIVCSGLIILALAVLNPPNIYIIMCLSGTVVVCSWFPVCIASIWSKRVTKTGAFCGMLCGFAGCSAVKIYASASGNSLPIFLDAFFVGLALNVLGLVIGSAVTQVTPEEKAMRARLLSIPQGELVKTEVKTTEKFLLGYIISGVLILLILLFLWAIPYTRALGT